jgi:hypothetical protein
MDGAHFDRLTRALASRRGLLGGMAGALLAWVPTAVARPNQCPEDRQCGNRCCKKQQTCKNAQNPAKRKCVHHCKDGTKNRGETDEDCGGTCRTKKKCRLAHLCKRDDDCQGDLFCIERETVCPGAREGVRRCFTCRTDGDCRPLKPHCLCGSCHQCREDEHCPRTGQPASLDKCVAPRSGGCPAGLPCKCRECRIDDDCAEGEVCDEDGLCELCAQGQGGQVQAAACPTSCVTDDDCQAGELCEDGTCVRETTCTAGQDFCLVGPGDGCDGNPLCVCQQTTSGHPFCSSGGSCFECAVDSDCAAVTGPGSVCIDHSGPECPGCAEHNHRACVRPC